MRLYNPFLLDTEKDEPTFVNEEGTKWWLVARGSHLSKTRDSDPETAWRVKLKEGHEAYVVMNGQDVVFDTSNLENALFRIDALYLMRTKE